MAINTIPFTSLFGRNEIQFGTIENQFGTNEIQFGTNENQFWQCSTNKIQFGRNEIQIDIHETISCFLLAIFIFWHNLKKFSFLDSYNMHVYSFIMCIYSNPIGDPIFGPNIMET